MSESDTSGVGDEPPPYMIFVVVFLFFLTGLLGFLVCHLLKKKGYRCRTGDVDFEEDQEDKLAENTGGLVGLLPVGQMKDGRGPGGSSNH